MALKTNKYMQGDVWLFSPDPIVDNELGKKIRPCVIMSSNSWNKVGSGLVIVLPLTSVDKNIFTHVRIEPPEGGLTQTSFALCEQIRSISRERLIKKLGSIKSQTLLHEMRTWLIDLTRIE